MPKITFTGVNPETDTVIDDEVDNLDCLGFEMSDLTFSCGVSSIHGSLGKEYLTPVGSGITNLIIWDNEEEE